MDKLLFSDATTLCPPLLFRVLPMCSSPAVRVVPLASPTWIMVRSRQEVLALLRPMRLPSQRVASNMSKAKLVHQRPTTPKKHSIVDDHVEHLSPSKKSSSDAVFSHFTNTVSSTSDDQDGLFGPLPLNGLLKTYKRLAATPPSTTSRRAGPASAPSVRSFKELDFSSMSLDLSPPPSHLLKVRLLPLPDNGDDT